MSLEARIGVSSVPSGPLEQPYAGVRFRIPYIGNGYDITLSNDEMNEFLGVGLDRLRTNQHMSDLGYDAEIELPKGDLPLDISLESIETHAKKHGEKGHKQDVNMRLIAITRSVVYEHRGILTSKRLNYDGLWHYMGYQALPKLK
jgi:hypothetical protein